ncbi:hypothetical protein BJ684DRAFT_15757 [Piptocephalis cylindrospora]|uniref:Protein kinase domain-containing protein n=1 Tax=Piptocephalis cylindrospora TaxID=1907219 RepID=A0A4P9Y4I6_9FUNG|nr:hypothetical protein BJ684DRAFT_15757 [Piptocephalis cylindrospora]|eukprot:RKP13886.1 hypothetical protein BJ684DRAFT_15757 [Piptocephalis cylindrospora]
MILSTFPYLLPLFGVLLSCATSLGSAASLGETYNDCSQYQVSSKHPPGKFGILPLLEDFPKDDPNRLDHWSYCAQCAVLKALGSSRLADDDKVLSDCMNSELLGPSDTSSEELLYIRPTRMEEGRHVRYFLSQWRRVEDRPVMVHEMRKRRSAQMSLLSRTTFGRSIISMIRAYASDPSGVLQPLDILVNRKNHWVLLTEPFDGTVLTLTDSMRAKKNKLVLHPSSPTFDPKKLRKKFPTMTDSFLSTLFSPLFTTINKMNRAGVVHGNVSPITLVHTPALDGGPLPILKLGFFSHARYGQTQIREGRIKQTLVKSFRAGTPRCTPKGLLGKVSEAHLALYLAYDTYGLTASLQYTYVPNSLQSAPEEPSKFVDRTPSPKVIDELGPGHPLIALFQRVLDPKKWENNPINKASFLYPLVDQWTQYGKNGFAPSRLLMMQ